MDVVYLSIIVYIIILIHYSISDHDQCPAHNTIGCWCIDNHIGCQSDYPGDDIPIFSPSHIIFELVSLN